MKLVKSDSDRVLDLTVYRSHYVLIKKLNVFLGDHDKNFICRRCLSSNTSESMLMLHKQKCENTDITFIRNSSESDIQWKKHFDTNHLFFKIYSDFEADNEKDNSCIGSNKTTTIYKQNPVCNGYRTMSEHLPYDETKYERNVKLEGILNTPDDSDIGYFIEVDLKYAYNEKEKTKNSP